MLSSWSCIPDSVPGIAYSVPGWFLDPEGPLAIRWRYLPQAMPWLLKFIRAGQADKIPAISDSLFTPNNPTVDLYKELAGKRLAENMGGNDDRPGGAWRIMLIR